MDITDFSMSELLKELATRVTCQEKKQTRAILIGTSCASRPRGAAYCIVCGDRHGS